MKTPIPVEKPHVTNENLSDSLSANTAMFDKSGVGIFGRKMISRYFAPVNRDLTVSGKISVKVCINTAGIVTYAELIQAETSIKDKEMLTSYLQAASGYKFQPDLTAPETQCGKLMFKIDNSVNNKRK
ncbi:MAG: hypothetical protein H7X99_07770 [Saprospiraceae bacterium]|nr:hypothetical protein [Saprospiraceae bacterium]